MLLEGSKLGLCLQNLICWRSMQNLSIFLTQNKQNAESVLGKSCVLLDKRDRWTWQLHLPCLFDSWSNIWSGFFFFFFFFLVMNIFLLVLFNWNRIERTNRKINRSHSFSSSILLHICNEITFPHLYRKLIISQFLGSWNYRNKKIAKGWIKDLEVSKDTILLCLCYCKISTLLNTTTQSDSTATSLSLWNLHINCTNVTLRTSLGDHRDLGAKKGSYCYWSCNSAFPHIPGKKKKKPS